jgi:hypothetical protein
MSSSNTSSNSSSNSSQPQGPPPPGGLFALTLNDVPNYIEFGARGFDFLVHLSYFLYIGLVRKCELRSRSYLYLHNVNIATFLVSIIYMVYIPYSQPSFSDKYTNRVLCLLTELAWSCLKYARVYSLLLLALYRFIGCFYVRLYKKINSRLVFIIGSILLCWLVSIGIPTIFKFALSTSYSLYFCVDGYAPRRLDDSVNYYIINTCLSAVLSTLVIVALYVMIYRKLRKQSKTTTTTNSKRRSEKSSKLERFSRQFIVLNALTALATAFATFVDFVNVIAVKFLSLSIYNKHC